MTAKFHFIAGLPRSGSTLLAALLRQNPRFHASMSSPLARMTSSVLVEMTGEDGPLVSPDKRRGVLRGLFDAYYAEESATREVIFDTNRGWGTRLPLLTELFGDVKMICMVRDVARVMDSFEVLVRKNVFERSGLFLDERERATVYSRTEALLLPNRTIGYALASLKEAVYGEHARSVLVVEYDHLVRFPAQTLRLIYQFLGNRCSSTASTPCTTTSPDSTTALRHRACISSGRRYRPLPAGPCCRRTCTSGSRN
ncbi:sulfotransferase family protein [Ralstonia syzygii subsp. celebesensis]